VRERTRDWLWAQVGLGGAGALTWYAGAASDSPFVTGVGIGLLVAALLVGVLRRRA